MTKGEVGASIEHWLVGSTELQVPAWTDFENPLGPSGRLKLVD
jgi:hypothetical protein